MSTLMEYKCPCCGGAIEFNSTIQKMKCPYCETEFDMEALKEHDEDLASPKEDAMNWEKKEDFWQEDETKGMQVYICQSCGGEIIASEEMGASTCPYCDNNIIVKGQFAGDLKPDYVIPFKLDKKAAKAALKKHLEGKKLLPRVFKSENHIDEIKGIYVPFWLFDANVEGKFHYKATRVHSWRTGDYKYTKTSHFSVVRGGKVNFDKIPVDGSTQMPDDLMESLEPYDFKEAVDFQTAYLSGYLADRYDVTAEDSRGRANERIKRSVEDILRSSVNGYATVHSEGGSVNMENGSYKYALYPVWILNTTWKGNKYLFAMNGQTGKFVGNLPIDKGAYFKWHGLFTVIFAILVYLVLGIF